MVLVTNTGLFVKNYDKRRLACILQPGDMLAKNSEKWNYFTCHRNVGCTQVISLFCAMACGSFTGLPKYFLILKPFTNIKQ